MNRISVTTLESFARYMREASSFDTEESFVETLKGLFAGNEKTKLGGAFHTILEGKYKIENSMVKVHVDGKGDEPGYDYEFTSDQAAPALEYRLKHPLLISEMKLFKTYQTSFGPIQVNGRVDGMEGLFIRDAKTKFRQISPDEYMESYQWKFYLDMMDLKTFYYDVFEVKSFETKYPFRIMEPVEIECSAYPQMKAECALILDQFMEYIQLKNYQSFLKPYIPIEELSF